MRRLARKLPISQETLVYSPPLEALIAYAINHLYSGFEDRALIKTPFLNQVIFSQEDITALENRFICFFLSAVSAGNELP
jgi:hypothetical protein